MWFYSFAFNGKLISADFLLNRSKKFQGKVKYVVRPVLPFGCEKKVGPCVAVGAADPVNLGGYGVELALKNMEYKAMDDSTVKEGQNICLGYFLFIRFTKKYKRMLIEFNPIS